MRPSGLWSRISGQPWLQMCSHSQLSQAGSPCRLRRLKASACLDVAISSSGCFVQVAQVQVVLDVKVAGIDVAIVLDDDIVAALFLELADLGAMPGIGQQQVVKEAHRDLRDRPSLYHRSKISHKKSPNCWGRTLKSVSWPVAGSRSTQGINCKKAKVAFLHIVPDLGRVLGGEAIDDREDVVLGIVAVQYLVPLRTWSWVPCPPAVMR